MLADHKWDNVFGVVLAEAQAHIAGRLCLPDAASVAVAPNTHELVTRVVSSLPSPVRVLTTDGEFHSFRRQINRWVEAGIASEVTVGVEPFATFPERFVAAASGGEFDLTYLSQVMYDSGFVVPDLIGMVDALPQRGEVIIDGYHGFMALPADIGAVADRAFYVAGGYKYAMAGEGACFMHCPPDRIPRPIDTGWYAGFAALEDQSGVAYAQGGGRFLGATFDPTPWYRFNAVQRMLNSEGITVGAIHTHVAELQSRFLDGIAGTTVLGRLVPGRAEAGERGHFLAFQSPDAAARHAGLDRAGVVVDRRGDRLRIGFGLYHDSADIDELLGVLAP
jgi:kynureninase